jgi:GT2 family glycosyltransferase
MIIAAEEYSFHGAGAQTRIGQCQTIWDRLLDDWWQYVRPQPGPSNVIGTPCLFLREVLLKVPFSEKPIMCDDTELCERLTKEGYRIGLVPVVIYDAANRSFHDVFEKFFGYGRSDADYYALNCGGWTVRRKIKSWRHPGRQAFRGISWSVRNGKGMKSALFHILIGMARYWGWIKTVMRRKWFGG